MIDTFKSGSFPESFLILRALQAATPCINVLRLVNSFHSIEKHDFAVLCELSRKAAHAWYCTMPRTSYRQENGKGHPPIYADPRPMIALIIVPFADPFKFAGRGSAVAISPTVLKCGA